MPDRCPYRELVRRVPVRRDERVVRGARTRTWIYGPAEATHRLLFLHGLRGDHHGLEPIVAHLPEVEVVVPDLPGFGESAPLPRDRHDLDGYGAWARELAATVSPTALAGHSFGSVLAAAAVAAGLPVAGLALVNPIAEPALGGPRRFPSAATAAYHRIAAVLPERAGTALLRSRIPTRLASAALVTTPDRSLRTWIHREHALRFRGFADRRVLLEAFTAATAHDVAEFAPRVRVPTLLVAGALDDMAPLPGQHRLARRFGDARLVVVPGTGHLAHYEAPAAVAEAITGLLADVRR